MSFRIRAFGRSDIGKVRARNEDTMVVEPSRGLVVVADGMGGAPAGHLASSLAVQEVARGIHQGEGMPVAIQRANRRIREFVRGQPELDGMGTTLTALKIALDSGDFVVGHVGDSRAYRLRNGSLSQITEDHTLVRDMVKAGKISARAERGHPLGHILSRVLGTDDEVEVDVVEGAAEDGDLFLLCSDGLMKVMEEEEIEEWTRRGGPGALEELTASIVEEGNRRGAPDNITVALLAVKASPFARGP